RAALHDGLRRLRVRDPRARARRRVARRRLRVERRGLPSLLLRVVRRAHPRRAATPRRLPRRSLSTAACRACRGTWPAPHHRIADLGPAVASLHDDQFFPGWTVLVLKRHATELWALAPTERAARSWRRSPGWRRHWPASSTLTR